MLVELLIMAQEICMDSRKPEKCIGWTMSCLTEQIKTRSEDDAWEICSETMPQDIWPVK